MSKSKKQTNKDYEQLGRIVANIYESGYLDKSQTYKMSFIKGLLAGLGGVIGATIVVTLLLWALTFFDNVPFVGRLTQQTRQTIQQSK
jgi:hypothetical protein